ncbi:hypothetical protein HZI73_04390 [Vallitalea pronyensis]|uniref:YbbR domain-containing protein n=1 Tax=Vallitalea pronyensis TaxID=1348613 RepID=A0A8J8MHE4_9FIRM|nr:CdaR family protein [Vallitalea pronyensis]QUI21576.1 hypothetical protein HZI73_04390 [Vallitalea pronyensis]
MGNIFTRNVGWKIVSIVLAFFIWFAVIRIEDPIDEDDYAPIPVQVLNGNIPIGDTNVITVNKKKQYITIDKGEYVNVRVSAKRSVLEKLRNGDIKATANIQELSPFGAIEVKIEGEEFNVVNIEPSHMYVSLENSKTAIKSINYRHIGTVKDSYRIIDTVMTPNTVEITGAESTVDSVDKVYVDIQVEGESKDVSTSGTIRLYQKNNDEVLLDKNIDKVDVLVKVRKYKTVTLNVNPSGKVANGHTFTGSSVTPKKVEIIGTEEAVNKVNIVTLPVSLEGLTEDTKITKNINDYLPDGVTVSTQSNEQATIDVKVDKIVDKEVTIAPNDIIAKLPPNGLKLSILDEEDIKLVFSGIQQELNRVTARSLVPSIDLSNLSEGTHEVSLVLAYPNTVELESDLPKITVELTKEVEDTTGDNPDDEPSTDNTDPATDGDGSTENDNN